MIRVRGQAEWPDAGQLLPLHVDAEQGHPRVNALDHHLVHIVVRQWKLDTCNSPYTWRVGVHRDTPPRIGATTSRTVGNDRLHVRSSRSRSFDTALCPFNGYPAARQCATARRISVHYRWPRDRSPLALD